MRLRLPAAWRSGKVPAMAPVRDAAAIVGDPNWLCHRYDPEHDAFHYRHVERARHATVPFLTDKELGEDPSAAVIRRTEARSLLPGRAPLHFIFHSAFCGSTMLVRALDLPGSAMGLSEPVLLNDLVGWRRRGAEPKLLAEVLADSLAQLARPFGGGEAVVIKPSNVFSGLAPAVLAMVSQARAILLAAPLPVFLTSVAGKGLDGRLWVRELLEGFLAEGLLELGFEPRDYLRQTDLQAAAVGWLAQQALFHRLAERFRGRVRGLDSETLTGEPASTVAASAAFLQLPIRPADDYARHPALARNSKSGERFAPGERGAVHGEARRLHGDEIDKVLVWAEAVARAAGIPLTAPAPLR